MAFIFLKCQTTQLRASLANLSREILSSTHSNLFLCVVPQLGKNVSNLTYSHISDMLNNIYQIFENDFSGKNIYLLLKNLIDTNNQNYRNSKKTFDIIIDGKTFHSSIINYINHHFNHITENIQIPHGINNLGKYSTVAVGGTFDRLHNGHKLLLSHCCLLTRDELIIGVTSDQMFAKKELGCLIQDFERRSSLVRDFCRSVMPSIKVVITDLDTKYGPAILSGKIDCLVVTEETVKFIDDLNKIRQKNGWEHLEIHTVKLIHASDGSKLSSTMVRRNNLGTLIKEPSLLGPKEFAGKAYLVGLTGCSCSGKSSIGRQFQKLGAGHIDLDKIAHQTYSVGTPVYHEVVKTFGQGILSKDESIDRGKLGHIVFKDRTLLEKLSSIVRPATRELAFKMAWSLWEGGCRVIIFDGAAIVEAKLHLLMDELWVAVLDRDLAVERLMERNQLTLEDARLRIEVQQVDSAFVKEAHVVFCTKWDYSETKAQINKTWSRLMNF